MKTPYALGVGQVAVRGLNFSADNCFAEGLNINTAREVAIMRNNRYDRIVRRVRMG
jgi:phage anti-repressor protein